MDATDGGMEMMARHHAMVVARGPSMKAAMTGAAYKSGAWMGEVKWRGLGRWRTTIGGDGVVARLDELTSGVCGQDFLFGSAGFFLKHVHA